MSSNMLKARFANLSEQLAEVEATRRHENNEFGSGTYVDSNKMLEWTIKVRNLLVKSCGPDSEHYKVFVEKEKGSGHWTNYGILADLKAVFMAAKEDFEGGYITNIQSIVQAELFSSELDQAKELLKNGYMTAGAVIAGVVLETSMRELCIANNLPISKLNNMNQDLAKAGVYNLLVQKRITTLADIRNNAAHGHPNQFSASDVAEMIQQVENFLADYL